MQLQKLVVVSGNIATGKTTLTSRLADTLGWSCELESVSSNPYLKDFYQDMNAWAFHTQLWFLLDRVGQHKKIARGTGSAILERSILEDRYVFAEVLRASGCLTERDYLSYLRLFEQITMGLTQPDLILYLHARPKILFDRVLQRGRQVERTITREYLSLIGNAYTTWINSVTAVPILRLDTEEHDFRNDSEVNLLADHITDVLHLH